MNVQADVIPEHLIEPRKLPLRVEDFIMLQESGALDAFAKSELIDGDVYTVNAIYRPHAGILADVNADLVAAVRAAPGVVSAGTTSLALGGVSVLRIQFGGDVAALRAALAARGLALDDASGVLRLRRAAR